MSRGRVGVVLDIDGVLLKGSHVISQSLSALQLLSSHSIPTVFVSNGGGITEEQKAKELTKKIGFSVNSDHVILSHTPFRQLSSQYQQKNVLIIGSNCLNLAKLYGYDLAMTSSMIHEKFPEKYPLKPPKSIVSSYSQSISPESIEAAFIFADSCDWGLDIQILTDLSINHQKTNPHTPFPIYACNADLVYNSTYPSPRYTQGAFVDCFQSLYHRYTSTTPQINFCGKPYRIQYEYAENILQQIAQSSSKTLPLTRYYGIGDNPVSDVRGTRVAGSQWKSILVRTGIFTGTENDPIDPADYVEENVLEAVKRIIQEEKLD